MSVPLNDPAFDGVWLKYDRAREHLKALKASLLAVIEGDANTGIQIKTDPNQTTWEAIVNLPGGPRINPMWNIWIGEFLYQLRSCLDHVINIVVPAQTKDTSFPIRDSEASFDNDTERPLEGIGTMDRTVAKWLQPFWLKPNNPRDTTPWALNELANLDRHRFIHVSGLWLTEESSIAFDPPGGGTVDHAIGLPAPLEDGAVIASGRIIRTPEQPKVDVYVMAVPDLVLTSIDAYRGPMDLRGLYVRGLEQMIVFVHAAIKAFEDPVSFLDTYENAP
jgi:hypothetical protein